MAGEIPDLVATVRTGTGKGAARQARRNGDVPGIVYGGGADPLPITINYNVLLKRLKQGRFLSTLFNLKVEGSDDVRVICRGVQRDVVKDLPTHVDLMRLRRESRIKPVHPRHLHQPRGGAGPEARRHAGGGASRGRAGSDRRRKFPITSRST